MRTLYGVGIGPGDPDLLTIKACDLIKNSDYVFIPTSKGKSLAAEIASKYLVDKHVVELEFPMGDDNIDRYIESAHKIKNILGEDESAVFLTLGDPLVYSTYIYLMREANRIGIKTYTIPGITSFSASASVIGLPLTLKDESFYLCDSDVDEVVLERVNSVAVLKVNRNKEKIINKLVKHNFTYAYVKRCTQEKQEILYDRNQILEDDEYMALIVGRRK